MKKSTPLFLLIFLTLLLSNCMGIRHITIDTREPGQIDWSPRVLSVVVVNNVVQQPDSIGHDWLQIGYQSIERLRVSSDSVAFIYTEALAQFIDEEEHFERVLFLHTPIRTDEYFFEERPLSLDDLRDILRETRADAIISLDRLMMQTRMREHFREGDFVFGELVVHIQSGVRIYMPTLEGVIPMLYNHRPDSLVWRGFSPIGRMTYGTTYEEAMEILTIYAMIYGIDVLPTHEEAMKILAIHTAERMMKRLSPHWVSQYRWFYTPHNRRMRRGAGFALVNQWDRALERWKVAFHSLQRAERAKAATNIALAYEVLDDLERAHEWAVIAHQLFEEHTSVNSLERRRSLLHKNELQRRLNNLNRLLDMTGGH